MPINKEYAKKVYDSLKSDVDGFVKTEDEFYGLIENDPNYRKNVHLTLKDVYGDGFQKDEMQFDDAMGLKKKDSTGPNSKWFSGVGGTEQEFTAPSPSASNSKLPSAPKTKIDALRDRNDLENQRVEINQRRLDSRRTLQSLESRLAEPMKAIEQLGAIIQDKNRPQEERQQAYNQYAELKAKVDPEVKAYEIGRQKYNQAADDGYRNALKLREAGMAEKAFKEEYSPWKNFIEQTQHYSIEAAAGLYGMANTMGLISGGAGAFSPEIREEVKGVARKQEEAMRKFGESLVTQEKPEDYKSMFEGKLTGGKVLDIALEGVASTVPTVLAGVFTGGSGAIAAGAGMMYEESKDILKQSGLSDKEAEFAALGLAIPLGMLEKWGADDAIKAIRGSGALKAAAAKIAKEAAGKTLTKSELMLLGKKTLGEFVVKEAPAMLKTGLKESATEVSQGTVNEIAKQVAQEYTGKDSDENVSSYDYWMGQLKQRGDEAVAGFLSTPGIHAAGSAMSAPFEVGSDKAVIDAASYQVAMDIKTPEDFAAFQQRLAQEVEDGRATEKQAATALKAVKDIQEADAMVPDVMVDPEARAKAVALIVEKNSLQKGIEGKDPTLSAPVQKKINEADKKLADLAAGKPVEVEDGKGFVERIGDKIKELKKAGVWKSKDIYAQEGVSQKEFDAMAEDATQRALQDEATTKQVLADAGSQDSDSLAIAYHNDKAAGKETSAVIAEVENRVRGYMRYGLHDQVMLNTAKIDLEDVPEKRRPIVQKVIKDIQNVAKAISPVMQKKFGKDVEVVSHGTQEEFDAAVKKAGGEVGENQVGKGFYLDDSGQIHLNVQGLSEDTMLHEGFHPVLDMMAEKSPEILDNFTAIIEEGAKADPFIKKFIVDHVDENYEGEGEVTIKKEKITEFIAKVANGDIKVKDRTLFEKVTKALTDLLEKLGIDLRTNIEDEKDLIKVARTISESFNKGKALKTGKDAIDGDKIDAKSDDSEPSVKMSKAEKIAKATEDKTVKGRSQPSMVLTKKEGGKDIVSYSGEASMDAIKKEKPAMYVSRALQLSHTHLVEGKVRKYNSSATQEAKIKWADSVYEKAKEAVVSNLLSIHDAIDPDIREISKLWYDGANIISQELAKKYNISTEQAAAVIATQSPQKPWFDNVHLAHFIIDYYANNQGTIFSKDHFDYFKEKATAATKANPNGYEAQIKALPSLESQIGRPYSEISTYAKSAMTRAEFDMNYDRKAPLRLPTGVLAGKQVGSLSSFSGYDTIAKGVSVLQDGSDKNISKNLGGAFKVRNFNNNISDPQMDREVTIDTHAIAASYMLPLGAKSKEVKFDEGAYAFFADAYREAAKKRGILAREMQSITWEGARALFPDNKKSAKHKESAQDIWNLYKKGDIAIEEAQKRIIENGEDLSHPDWASSIGSAAKGSRASDYIGELPVAGRHRPTATKRDITGSDRGVSGVEGTDTGNKRKRRGPQLSKAQQETHVSATVNVAPLHSTYVNSLDQADRVFESDFYKNYIEEAKATAKEFGVKVVSSVNGMGGFDSLNEATTEFVVEGDLEDILKFAAVMGAMAPESQDSTIAALYVKDGDENHNAYRLTAAIDDEELAASIASEVGLNKDGCGYTIKDGEISFMDVFEYPGKDFGTKLELFYNKYTEHGKQITERPTEAIRFEYIDQDRRQDILRQAEGDALRQQQGRASGNPERISAAQKRNQDFVTWKNQAYSPEAKEYSELRKKQIELSEKGGELSQKEYNRIRELEAVMTAPLSAVIANEREMYLQAKAEVEAIAEDVVKLVEGGFNAKFGIKNPDRAAIKTVRWYDSKPIKLGDGARTNIIVNTDGDADFLFTEINKRYSTGTERKEFGTTELGYPKRLTELRVSNGKLAEIQVMTPQGYLAKDGVKEFPKEDQQKAQESLDEVRERLGWPIPDGVGHYFYEVNRDTNVPKPLRDEAARLSVPYYKAFLDPNYSIDQAQWTRDVAEFKSTVDAADKSNWDKSNKAVSPKELDAYLETPSAQKVQMSKGGLKMSKTTGAQAALDDAYARRAQAKTKVMREQIDEEIKKLEAALERSMMTGVKKSEVDQFIDELGMDPYEIDRIQTDEIMAAAKKEIDRGYDPKPLITKIENGYSPSTKEVAILTEYIAALQDRIDKDPGDSTAYADAVRAAAAIRKSGTLQAQSFAMRKKLTRKGDTLLEFFLEDTEANLGAPLTEGQREIAKKEFDAIKAAKDALEEKVAKLVRENAALKAKQTLKSKVVFGAAPRVKKTHDQHVSDRDKIRENIKAKLNKMRGQTPVTIPYVAELVEIAPDIVALAKSYIDEGVNKFDDIIDKVYDDVRDAVNGMTREDVIHVIAGEYNDGKPTKSVLTRKMAELKRQAKLITKIEELQAGRAVVVAKQSGSTDPEIEALEKKAADLRKRNALLDKLSRLAMGLTTSRERKEIEYNQELEGLRKQIREHDLTRLDTYKKRVESAIDKVKAQIDSGDFTPEDKGIVRLDAEAVRMRDELVRLRKERSVRIEQEKYKNRTTSEKIKETIIDILNMPRTLKSSVDFSAPLRQALVATTSHPVLAAAAMKEMFKYFGSQKYFDRWFHEVRQDPRFDLWEQMGLYIADPHDIRLSGKEEQFTNNLAEKIPGWGSIMVKTSERAYIGYLNKMRWDLYNQLAEQLERSGMTPYTHPKEFKDMASFVNNATGRGKLIPTLEKAAPALNAVFFAPRFWASRLNFINPVYYAKLSAPARKQAIYDVLKAVSVGMSVLAMVQLMASDDDDDKVSVEADPRSTDFGKVRIGDTRWDIWGGYQQNIRVLAQLLSGQTKSAMTGEMSELGAGGLFGRTRGDVASSFIRTKLAPIPGTAVDAAFGRNVVGEKFKWFELDEDNIPSGAIPQLVSPLIFSSIHDTYKNDGMQRLLTTVPFELFGVGISSYKKRDDKYVIPEDGEDYNVSNKGTAVLKEFAAANKANKEVDKLAKKETWASMDASYNTTEKEKSMRDRMDKHPRMAPGIVVTELESYPKSERSKKFDRWSDMGLVSDDLYRKIEVSKDGEISVNKEEILKPNTDEKD